MSFKGLTLGRDVTTFCDLQAAPTTIDFQGPNAYNFNFATMIRYEVSFARRHMTFGVAAEMPNVSATYGENFKPMHQRVPDFPMYLQYAWGDDRSSHIRASGVIRNPYMHKVSKKFDHLAARLGRAVQRYDQVLRLVPALHERRLRRGHHPLYSGPDGFGARLHAQSRRSVARAHDADVGLAGRRADQHHAAPVRFGRLFDRPRAAQPRLLHRRPVQAGGQYIFGNIFYSLTPRCKVAGEYLYGSRKDMNSMKNHANRVNVMVQYSF